jgi:hypothetical protein
MVEAAGFGLFGARWSGAVWTGGWARFFLGETEVSQPVASRRATAGDLRGGLAVDERSTS